MAAFPDYQPTYSITKKSEPKTRMVQFGDGYQQRRTVGLHQNPKKYDLEFILKDADAAIVEAFLDARAADAQSFGWTPPDSSTEFKWVCPNWTREFLGPNVSRIQTQFSQVFEP